MVAVDPIGFGGPPRMTDEQWANLEEDEGSGDSSDEK